MEKKEKEKKNRKIYILYSTSPTHEGGISSFQTLHRTGVGVAEEGGAWGWNGHQFRFIDSLIGLFSFVHIHIATSPSITHAHVHI